MAIDIISGFLNSSSEPLDVKELVADSTARLAIEYPFKGLRVKQEDTEQIYEYIGTPTSNIASDWELRPTLRTGTVAPDNADGVDGDIYFNSTNNYFYEKVTGTWELRADLTGSQIFQGTAVPDNGDGVEGDIYFRSNGDVYQKGASTWGSVLFNIAGASGADGDKYAATSATNTENIPTSHPTDVALTLDASTYAYTPGQSVVAAEDATNFFEGTVKSYVGSVLTITSSANTGTGSAPTPSWTVNLDGATGTAGAAGKPGAPDVTYTGANGLVFDNDEIDNVIEPDGQWTVDNPFYGYVLQDDRAANGGDINAPAAIAGDKSGYMIEWNGSAWRSLGKVRGPSGTPANHGYSPVLNTVTRDDDEEVLQIGGWTGGSGDLPAELVALIGKYISGGGPVTDIELATNIKGNPGNDGVTLSNAANKTFLHPASHNIPIGVSFTEASPPQTHNVNFASQVGSRKSMVYSATNTYSSEGNETVYVIARIQVSYIDVGQQDDVMSWEPELQSSVHLQVHASYNGTFSSSQQYGYVLCESTRFGINGGQSQMLEVRFAFKFPRSGAWKFKLSGTSAQAVQWSASATGIIYEVFVLNRN